MPAATSAPATVATVVDTADEVIARLQRRGVDVDDRVQRVLGLAEKLTEAVNTATAWLSAHAVEVTLGVILGLVFGKQVGITLFSWLAVKSGKAALPEGVDWGDLYGAACLGGIGFTMSLFISGLSFTDPALLNYAKLGVLSGSVLSACAGLAFLGILCRRNRERKKSSEASSRAIP